MSYSKSVKIDFESGSVKKIEKTEASFSKTVKEFSRNFSVFSTAFSKDSTFGSSFKSYEKITSFGLTSLKAIFSNDLNAKKELVDTLISGLSSLVSNAFEELDTLLSYSRLSSSETRDLMFGYGFSSSQAYAWSKSMEALGFGSEEDLYWANQKEWELFRSSFAMYAKKYDELYDSGLFDTMREYDIEMKNFKEEVELEIVSFFMQNKDTLKTSLIALIKLSEFVILTLGKFVTHLVPTTIPSSSDISTRIAQMTNSSTVNNNTVSISNSYSGIATESKLMSDEQIVYEQLAQIFGG